MCLSTKEYCSLNTSSGIQTSTYVRKGNKNKIETRCVFLEIKLSDIENPSFILFVGLTFDNRKRINRLKRLAPKKPNPFHFIEKVNPNNTAARHKPRILGFSFFKTATNMSNDKKPKKLM